MQDVHWSPPPPPEHARHAVEPCSDTVYPVKMLPQVAPCAFPSARVLTSGAYFPLSQGMQGPPSRENSRSRHGVQLKLPVAFVDRPYPRERAVHTRSDRVG